MILSDRSIKQAIAQGRLVVAPLDPADIQPASIDLHLGPELLAFPTDRQPAIDTRAKPPPGTLTAIPDPDTPYFLHPGEFILGSTVEHIELAADLVARLEGKSSLGRLGLVIHSTAGFVDPGWKGTLTLELSNLARLPITLYQGMKIGQLSLLELTTPADRPYGHPELGSRYQGQTRPTASRIHQEKPPR